MAQSGYERDKNAIKGVMPYKTSESQKATNKASMARIKAKMNTGEYGFALKSLQRGYDKINKDGSVK